MAPKPSTGADDSITLRPQVLKVVFPSLLDIAPQRASAGTCAIGTIPDSVAEQTELALQDTVEFALEGLTMADLFEVASYHVDPVKNIRDFLSVKEQYVARPLPAWSIIGVEV